MSEIEDSKPDGQSDSIFRQMRGLLFPLTVRRLVALSIVASVLCGILFLWGDYSRKHSYPYNASFSVLQFGNINGDGLADLMTYGYRGQAAGNPRWFPGRGNGFDSLNQEHFASYGAILADLDGDGDADMLSDNGIFRNDVGTFINVPHDPDGDYKDGKTWNEFIMLLMINFEGFVFDLYVCDLSSDGFPEIILLGDSETIIGIGKAKFDWQFAKFPKQPATSLDRSNEGSPELVFLLPPDAGLISLLENERIRYREYVGGPPQQERGQLFGPNRDEYHWLDVDGDGTVELVLCSPRRSPDLPFDNMFSATIKVYRDKDGKFVLLATSETESYPKRQMATRLSRPPFPFFEFVDFDKDGRLDLLCQDRWIYKQQKGFVFARAVKLSLIEEGVFPATLFAHDVNADGWPDVVSSYQPYWNIAFGPLLPQVPGR
ncbi:MAG: VCBS repeat-containing protein [Planctomycetota bacterium]|nr:VCBS repeat-containing protein [Planctomycetota bacterium]MDA1141711.1 VCBS repeat-containing protein [Planctomycetota bacterium]